MCLLWTCVLYSIGMDEYDVELCQGKVGKQRSWRQNAQVWFCLTCTSVLLCTIDNDAYAFCLFEGAGQGWKEE